MNNKELAKVGVEQIVSWHEIDNKQLLRPVAFMNIAQELANVQASLLKFGYYELISLNQVWVLSRIKIRFFNPPKWGDKIKMVTWHKGQQAFYGLRDFVLYKLDSSKESEICAAAVSFWVIINTQTRRIERNNVFAASEYAQSFAVKENAIEDSCGKLIAPKEIVKIGEHTVMYSDVDFNHHANNAKYIEWIMDYLPLEYSLNKTLKAIQINYITETILGDKIEIYMSETSINDEKIYMEGKKGDVVVFQAELEF